MKKLLGLVTFLLACALPAFGQAYLQTTLSYPQARSTSAAVGSSSNCILSAPGSWAGVISLDGANSASGPWRSLGSLNVPGTLPIPIPTTSPVPTYFSVSGIFNAGSVLTTNNGSLTNDNGGGIGFIWSNAHGVASASTPTTITLGNSPSDNVAFNCFDFTALGTSHCGPYPWPCEFRP